MNRTRIGLAVFLIGAVAVGLSYFSKQSFSDSHRRTRQVILHYTLSRVDNPIIIVGDSIVEASTLPRELCGHAIVNAGLNGASTTSDLGTWLIDELTLVYNKSRQASITSVFALSPPAKSTTTSPSSVV